MADEHGYFEEASWTLFGSDEAPPISPKFSGPPPNTEARQDMRSDESDRRWDMDITAMFADAPRAPYAPPPATGPPHSSNSNSVSPDSQVTVSGLRASVISEISKEDAIPDSLPSGDETGPHLCRAEALVNVPVPPEVSLDAATPLAVPPADAFDDEANSAASSVTPPPSLPQSTEFVKDITIAASTKASADQQSQDAPPAPPSSLPQSAEHAKELIAAASTESSADRQSQAASPSPPASPPQSAESPKETATAASTGSSTDSLSPATSPSPPPSPPQAAGPSNPLPAAAPPVPVGMSFPVAKPSTYYTPTFPPGQDRPGFVPFGRRGPASVHQGNYWPIDLELRSQLIRAETDANKLRSADQRLTYGQVLTKYNTWNGGDGLNQNTMRYHNRKFTNPIRDRVVKFRREHLRALRRAVPASRNAKGKVAWNTVREKIEEDTGRLFGLATLVKQWRKMGNEEQGGNCEGSDRNRQR